MIVYDCIRTATFICIIFSIMGCGLIKSTHSEGPSYKSESVSIKYPIRNVKYSLFTVNEELSQCEQSRYSSRRVSNINPNPTLHPKDQ